jgi:hypothetical protein
MENRSMKRLLVIMVGVMVTSGAMAEDRLLQLSLTPNIAVFDRSETIKGFTLGIWSENPQSAFALGIINGSSGQSAGLSVGIVNYAGTYTGLQWGFVNLTTQDTSGWQGGFLFGIVGSVVNYTGGTMKGFQCGVVNYAGRLKGFQLGFVNYAADADGAFQIGLVNIIPRNQYFTALPEELAPGMTVINWRWRF